MADFDVKSFLDEMEKRGMIVQRRNETRDGSHWDDWTYKNITDAFDKSTKQISDEIDNRKKSFTDRVNSIANDVNDKRSAYDKRLTSFNPMLKELVKQGYSHQEIVSIYKEYRSNLKNDYEEAEKAVKDFSTKEKEYYQKKNKDINDINKAREQAKKRRERELNESAKSEVFGKITGGKSDMVYRNGENTLRFGKALRRYGRSKGGAVGQAMTKLGSAIGVNGIKLMKGAGPIGVALKAIEIGGKLIGGALNKYGEYLQYKAEQQRFENQKQAVIQQRQMTMVQNEGELIQAEQQNTITKAQNEINSKASLAVAGNAIVQDAQASGVEIGLKSLTDIAGGAFEAAAKSIDIKYAAAKFQNDVNVQREIVKAQNAAADVAFKSTRQNIAAKNATAQMSAGTQLDVYGQQQAYSRENYVNNQVNSVASNAPVIGEALGEVGNGYANMRKSQQDLNNAQLEGTNQLKMFGVQMNETKTSIKTSLENSAAEFNSFATSAVQNMNKAIYDAEQDRLQRIEKAWLQFTHQVFDGFQKAETAAFQMGRSFNFNNDQLNSYAQNLSKTQITVSQWGKNMEDMMKMQTSFQENTGRNKFFSEKDFNKSFANGLLVGDDIVSQLNSGMEIFNVSVADSNDMFYEMYKSVTKMGLSGRKYAKDLVQNLKLAEKYNFKGGVKSLMEMSKWAQNVRFNTSSLDGMLDKVQEGGLEGIIKQAAELQVLGGNFAMGSDPLAMAYESYADPEAYAKRMNGMIAGQGVFNSETGNISFGIASQQIMRQFAKSTGQDYKDVLNQARQEVRVNKIRGVIGDTFNEDQLSAIANNAKYENGEWTVNLSNGETKNVSELTSDDLSLLRGEGDSTKSMEENISSMKSTQEQMKGVEAQILAKMENNLWETMKTDAEKMIENINTEFETNMPEYIENVKTKMDEVVTDQQSMISKIMGGQDGTLSTIQQTVSGLSKAVTGAINETNGKLQSIAQSLSQHLNDAQNTDVDIDTLREKITDKQWLQRAQNDKDSEEFKLMRRLYNNFGGTMTAMGVNVTKDGNLTGNARDWAALKILSRWDPDYDVGDAILTYEQKQALENHVSGKWQQSLIEKSGYNKNNMFAEGASVYSNNSNQTEHEPKTVEEWSAKAQNDQVVKDGLISTSGKSLKINDGIVVQNGVPTRIDKNDQVLAAKEGGPLDKMLNIVQPIAQQYKSYVKEYPTHIDKNDQVLAAKEGGSIKIEPINININGNITLNGTSLDLTTQIQNDPNFKNALWKLISVEVAKRADNTGRVGDPLYNRIQTI